VAGLGKRLQSWGGVALRNPMLLLFTFLFGGAFTFGYSYVPLHTVNIQKAERLERTVLTQESEIEALAYQVEQLEAAAQGGLDAGAAAALQSERMAAQEENELLRQEVDRAKKRTKQLERERSEWRRRVSALEKKLKTATTELAQRPELTSPPVSRAIAPALVGPGPAAPERMGPPSAPAP